MGMSPHTLRYYSKEGLLPFVDRSASNVRMFSDDDFEWIFLINCLKKSGMSIKDIRRFIELALEGDATLSDRLEMFAAQQQEVERQIAELEDVLDVLKYKRWRYETSVSAGTAAVHEAMDPLEIPEDVRAIKERVEADIARAKRAAEPKAASEGKATRLSVLTV